MKGSLSGVYRPHAATAPGITKAINASVILPLRCSIKVTPEIGAPTALHLLSGQFTRLHRRHPPHIDETVLLRELLLGTYGNGPNRLAADRRKIDGY